MTLWCTWTHRQRCYLRSLGVSGLSTIRHLHPGDPTGVDQGPACVQVALPHPRLSFPDPQPPRCNFCCLGGHLDGPSPTGSCDAQYAVGTEERLACEPSATHFNGSSRTSFATHCFGILRLAQHTLPSSSCWPPRNSPPRERWVLGELPACRLPRSAPCLAFTLLWQQLLGTSVASPGQLSVLCRC